MGCKTKDLFSSDGDRDRDHDALILTSMCIIGLPVEVQVKDGSIYSGIVHTACFDNQYGIILKRAKMMGTDKSKSAVVGTLVVSSSDLVQVVVKGFVLPSQGFVTDAPDHPIILASTRIRKHHHLRLLHSRSSRHNKNRSVADLTNKEAGDDLSQGPRNAKSFQRAPDIENSKSDDATIVPVGGVDERQAWNNQLKVKKSEPSQNFGSHKDTSIQEVQLNEVGSNDSLSQLQSTFSTDMNICKTTSKGPSCGNSLSSLVRADAQDFERPTSTGSCSDVCSPSEESVDMSSQLSNCQSTSQTTLIAPGDSVSNASSKEFKLNPGAKTFMPLFSIPKSASSPAPATTATTNDIPDTFSTVPIAVAPQEKRLSHFISRSSLPTKIVRNDNAAMTGDSAFQYSQPVMVSRFGQLVYMHPISHDLIQSSAVPTTAAVRPQLTSQVYLPKHQGSTAAQALQVCVTQQPFVVGGQQPYAMASHILNSQPSFPAVRPIYIPGANGHL